MKPIFVILGIIILAIDMIMLVTVTAGALNFILMKLILPTVCIGLLVYGAFSKKSGV